MLLELLGSICTSTITKTKPKKKKKPNVLFQNNLIPTYCSVSKNTNPVWWYLGFPSGSAVKNLPAMQKMQETLVQSLGWKGFPGGGHDNPLQYLAWRIPWTEEPGRLQSIGSQRVGHYGSNLEHMPKWYLGEGFMFRVPGKISLPGGQYPEACSASHNLLRFFWQKKTNPQWASKSEKTHTVSLLEIHNVLYWIKVSKKPCSNLLTPVFSIFIHFQEMSNKMQ